MFEPKLDILPDAQRALWAEVAAIPLEFVLCGGTAIALQLAGMKAAVVQQRAEAKDYVDLHALLEAGIGLPAALAAARVIYGERFNPQLTLKALSFFGDGDLASLPTSVQERIIGAVRDVNLDRLPVLLAYDEPTNPWG
jgi:hypothetical protein